jgi:NAD(P)-dependent dehydrogenase (short-subunit alcohol dehydrogenase family)
MPNVIAVPCDVTDPDQVLAAARTVGGHTGGRLNLLINNAGYSPHEGVIEAASMTEYRRAFEVNFWGPVQVVQAMTPLLRASKGRIINTTSGSVYVTIPMASAYPTSKSALKTFTRHLRMELAPFGIEVTSLEPGGVETAMTEMGPEVEERQWTSIPEPVREQYRRHFLSAATAIADNFTFQQPDVFAFAVWEKVICAKRLKPSYLIGPKVAVLPWLHRLPLAEAPTDDRIVRDIWLLRLRALLAHAKSDDTAYRDYRDRYRAIATELGFEGHMTWAEAMP